MVGKRRKVRDRDEAELLLHALGETGESLGEFCSHRGLDARSLHCWRLNLSRSRSPSPPRLRLVELVAKPLAVEPRSYQLHVGDVTIEVGDDFDDDSVARLLALVRPC